PFSIGTRCHLWWRQKHYKQHLSQLQSGSKQTTIFYSRLGFTRTHFSGREAERSAKPRSATCGLSENQYFYYKKRHCPTNHLSIPKNIVPQCHAGQTKSVINDLSKDQTICPISGRSRSYSSLSGTLGK